MLSLETQYRLKDFFQLMAQAEMKIEGQRQRLASLHAFDPYSAFCRINRSITKTVTSFEIKMFMQDNNICAVSEQDCNLIVNYFDSDKDCALNFKELLELMLPCDDVLLRSQVTQKQSQGCGPHDRLNSQVERELAELFRFEIEFHTQLRQAKINMFKQSDWDDIRAFNCVDQVREGAINFNNLTQFCRLTGYRVSDFEVVAMIRRMDIDADSCVTQAEFCQFLHPIESIYSSTQPIVIDHNEQSFGLNEPLRKSPARERSTSKGPLRQSPPRNVSFNEPLRHSPKRHSTQHISPQRQSNIQIGDEREAPIQRQFFNKSQEFGKMIQASNSDIRGIGRKSPLRSVLKEPSYSMLNQHQTPKKQVDIGNGLFKEPRPDSPLRQSPEKRREREMCNKSFTRRSAVTQRLASISTNKVKYGYISPVKDVKPVNDKPYQIEQFLKKRQPLQIDEEEQLLAAFREWLNFERDVEDAKIRLVSQLDFNLMDGFQMIDTFGKGWISAPDLQLALENLDLYPLNKTEVELFVRHFDKDNDGRINYSDFCEAFCPKDSLSADLVNQRDARFLHNQYLRREEYFCVQTRQLFLNVFKAHFESEDQSECKRKLLSRRPHFKAHDAWMSMDTMQSGYLTKQHLSQLLSENKIFNSEVDLTMLMSRFDRNSDGKIDYPEFIDEFTPKTLKKEAQLMR